MIFNISEAKTNLSKLVNMAYHGKKVVIAKNNLPLTSSLDLNEVFTTISQGLVDQLGADFARIWLLGPGDLCDECFKASSCN